MQYIFELVVRKVKDVGLELNVSLFTEKNMFCYYKCYWSQPMGMYLEGLSYGSLSVFPHVTKIDLRKNHWTKNSKFAYHRFDHL